jgi:hypothetical protein
VKIRDADACWKRFLALESLVEAFAKVRLNTQSLKNKYAHSDQALLRRIVALINCIIEHQNNEVMGSICVDNKRAKPFIALKCFPEKHDHFRCPSQRLLASWEVRGCCLKLFHLAKVAYGNRITYRLVKNPRHPINKKLEVLWSMQPTEEVPEEVLWWRSISRFRYRVEDQYQKQLQTIGHQNLLRVFEHNVVIWYTPRCGVVF